MSGAEVLLRGALLLAAITLTVTLNAVGAAAEQAYVANTIGEPIWVVLVPGSLHLLLPGERLAVTPPAAACVAQESLVVYLSVGERLVARAWLRDWTLVNGSGRCVEISGPGVYTPLYVREALLTVESDPPGLVSYQLWAEEGRQVNVSVPEVIELEEARYAFAGWRGAPLPPRANVSIPLVTPTTLTAIYDVAYRVRVTLEPVGAVVFDGFLDAGAVFLPRLDPIIYQDNDTRLVLASVTVNGAPLEAAGQQSRSLRVTGPLDVRAYYRVEYRILVVTPAGTSEMWAPPGGRVALEAPQVYEGNSTARLVFTGWLGVNATTPTATVTVTGPAVYKAVYEREYLVSFTSPLGSWERWAREGSIVPIVQPERLPGIVYDRVLAYYIVNGGVVQPTRGGVLLLKVDGPATVTAVYVVSPNIVHLALLAGFILSVAALYLAFQVYQAERRGSKQAPMVVGPGGGGATD